jgi:hypothetical protein
VPTVERLPSSEILYASALLEELLISVGRTLRNACKK